MKELLITDMPQTIVRAFAMQEAGLWRFSEITLFHAIKNAVSYLT